MEIEFETPHLITAAREKVIHIEEEHLGGSSFRRRVCLGEDPFDI
jgi:hypothetical protein